MGAFCFVDCGHTARLYRDRGPGCNSFAAQRLLSQLPSENGPGEVERVAEHASAASEFCPAPFDLRFRPLWIDCRWDGSRCGQAVAANRSPRVRSAGNFFFAPPVE